MAEDMIERAIEAYVANAMGGLPDQVALRAALLAALDPILVLIPTDLATDGDLSFWVKELDPAHNTTGRSMNPDEREHLKLTAYRVLSAMVKARDALDANAQGEPVLSRPTPAAMALRDRHLDGEFDASREEGEAWFQSEGKHALMSDILDRKRNNR